MPGANAAEPTFEQLAEFNSDLSKLRRKYPHIADDFEKAFKKALVLALTDPLKQSICDLVKPPGLQDRITNCTIYKARKMYSTDLRRSDKFRIILAHHEHEGTPKVVFLEIYCKNHHQQNFTQQLVEAYIRKCNRPVST